MKHEEKVGKKFGKLTVLGLGSIKDGNLYLNCRCDCGKVKEMLADVISAGKSSRKSCGCQKGIKYHDIEWQQFSNLIAISFVEKIGPLSYWQYFCLLCGQTCCLSRSRVSIGTTKSCRCLHNKEQRENIEDLTGQRFHKLLVKKRVEKPLSIKFRGVFWLCQCDCGKEKVISSNLLKQNRNKSCGCNLHRKGKDSPLWKGDKHERWRPTNHVEYQEWRKKVKKRDNYTCQISGLKNSIRREIDVHHLHAWQSYPDLRYDISNGIVMWSKLHTLFHGLYGRGDNTPEQFQEFKQRYDNREFDEKYYP